MSPDEAKIIINLFRKISAAAKSADIKDDYCKYAFKAKSSGVSEDKFKNMVEYLIKGEELAD